MPPDTTAAEHGPLLPYGQQWVDEQDIEAVAEVLRSDWLTGGPAVERLEATVARAVAATEAVAVSSGTAALHAAMHALGIGPGDEVIVPAMTFAATANCVAYVGAQPVFADVTPDTLLIDPEHVESLISRRTRAFLAVDYAGQPCVYSRLRTIARRHGLALAADACHALGATDCDEPVGSLADVTVFSLHPVKPITAGEGGLAVCADPALARRMRNFRNHGLDSDARQRAATGGWQYDMTELGYNYRLSDIHAALALSQLRRLVEWTLRRREIAAMYGKLLRGGQEFRPLAVRPTAAPAWHLYVVRVATAGAVSRDQCLAGLRTAGIAAGVHYRPVHLHSYYRQRHGTRAGMCPVAERAYEEVLSLPIFPRMTAADPARVVRTLSQCVSLPQARKRAA